MKKEREVINKRNVILGLVLIIAYLFFDSVPSFTITINKGLYYPSLIICNIVVIIIAILCFKEKLKEDLLDIKENKKFYVKFIIKNQFIMYGLYILAAVISVLILNDDTSSLNQQALLKLPMYVLIFSATIYASIVEELVYRGTIRRFIKNNIIFIIVSGGVFGLLHTLGEPTLFEALVRGLPYVTVGCYFAYLYVKTENVITSIISHFIHNSFALILIFIMSFI
jgi:hypothetical protein